MNGEETRGPRTAGDPEALQTQDSWWCPPYSCLETHISWLDGPGDISVNSSPQSKWGAWEGCPGSLSAFRKCWHHSFSAPRGYMLLKRQGPSEEWRSCGCGEEARICPLCPSRPFILATLWQAFTRQLNAKESGILWYMRPNTVGYVQGAVDVFAQTSHVTAGSPEEHQSPLHANCDLRTVMPLGLSPMGRYRGWMRGPAVPSTGAH